MIYLGVGTMSGLAQAQDLLCEVKDYTMRLPIRPHMETRVGLEEIVAIFDPFPEVGEHHNSQKIIVLETILCPDCIITMMIARIMKMVIMKMVIMKMVIMKDRGGVRTTLTLPLGVGVGVTGPSKHD